MPVVMTENFGISVIRIIVDRRINQKNAVPRKTAVCVRFTVLNPPADQPAGIVGDQPDGGVFVRARGIQNQYDQGNDDLGRKFNNCTLKPRAILVVLLSVGG